MNEKFKIMRTKYTESVGIVDHECFIEEERGDGFVDVLVIDLDGGLAGPYRIKKEDIQEVQS